MTNQQMGFIRLPDILSNKVPVSASTWWKNVASGIYPPAKKLSARTTAWKNSDIIELCELLAEGKDWRDRQESDAEAQL